MDAGGIRIQSRRSSGYSTYVSKNGGTLCDQAFNLGEVKNPDVVGRPVDSVSTHFHVDLE